MLDYCAEDGIVIPLKVCTVVNQANKFTMAVSTYLMSGSYAMEFGVVWVKFNLPHQ